MPPRKIDSMESEVLWQAIRRRDARFNGAFVFGVKTTGVFCKPSCSARAAKRENVVFFHAPMDAEAVGFRACLRCKPAMENDADPQIQMILRACELLEGDEPLTLESVAAQIGLSTAHFQRTFTNIVGISPKKYAEAKRMESFKDELRGGSDVVTAMYDAGFGSSSRLYEKAIEKLGMTPAVYKKGGKGMAINYTIAECELGLLLVARTPRGICSVTFGDSREQLSDDLHAEFPNAQLAEDAADLGNAVESIVNYLSGKQRRLVLPLDLRATAFQLQVWEALKNIPYGETRSYSQIAEQLGDKKKVRAVAQACARNRVALVIPCHRVVGSDGSITGYRWGVERKKKLLAKEKTA
jgi:AraC family transcriptional regulator of adaptative response/methylated-DNA-[protein]-cysteine methyltransferase